MSELLRDIRDHWNDQYWWADHPELRIILLSIISGTLGLTFVWLEVKLKQRLNAGQ